MAFDPISGGIYEFDPISGGVPTNDPIMQAMATGQQTPATPFILQPGNDILHKPNLSRGLLQAGLAMIAADQQGVGNGGSLAAGLAGYAKSLDDEKTEARERRRDQLAEYELLGRIRERQGAEMAAARNVQIRERLKKQNPQLADLIDLDPDKAAEVLAKQVGGAGSGPYEGTALDAQNLNILLAAHKDPSLASTPGYAAAYNAYGAPKVTKGADGTTYTETPNMSAFIVPTFNGSAPAAPAADPMAAPQPATPVYGDKGGVAVGDPTSFGVEKSAAAGYAQRMQNADSIFDTLETEDTNAKSGKTGAAGYAEAILSAVPSMGLTDAMGQGIVKSAASPNQQKYLNAAEEWIRAKLRKESGAAIGAQEMINEYSTYFPTAGDTKEVIDQKRTLRLNATQAMKAASGGAYEGLFESNKEAPKAPAAPKAASSDGVARPKTKAEFDALPPGTMFKNPSDGKVMRKR